MKNTLDAIGIFHQTDKASQFTRTYAKPHDYLRHMQPFFDPMRPFSMKLVEIGAAGGESIRMWLDFFEFGEVIGVDLVHDTNPFNTIGTQVNSRYKFEHGDQGDAGFWARFIATHGPTFDVVVDDGSHFASDVITTFNALWQHVSKGGVYIIEDLNTAYGGAPFTVQGQPTQMDFLKNLLDVVNRQGLNIERIQFSRELCIIQKAHV